MIELREMTLDDIDRVYQIEAESFTEPISRASFRRDLEENSLSRYRVLEKDGQIIGYFSLWLVGSEGHILSLAIDKEMRSMGYGSKLVEAIIDLAREEGIDRLTLEVRQSNYIARQLYEKFAFKSLGVRKDYYNKPKEDAIIMWLNLEEQDQDGIKDTGH